jgi:hypothetical protein
VVSSFITLLNEEDNNKSSIRRVDDPHARSLPPSPSPSFATQGPARHERVTSVFLPASAPASYDDIVSQVLTVPASTQTSPSLSLTASTDFHIRASYQISLLVPPMVRSALYSMPHTQLRTPQYLSSTTMTAVGTSSDTSVNSTGPRIGWSTRIAAPYAGQSVIE